MALAPPPVAEPAPDGSGDAVTDTSRRHIRGSSLLFAGRLTSVVVNFATQVLIVRYLSKADFGVFAYGLALVSMGQSVAVLGLDKAVSRFLPIYDEQRAHDKLLGALLLVLATIVALGAAIVALVFGLYGLLGGPVAEGGTAVTVLFILILLAPVQALDDILMSTFAVFTKPRAIFFRKYVLAPGLRLTAILVVIAGQSDVRGLAVGYVAAGALGVTAYGAMLIRTLRAQGILGAVPVRSVRVPAREIYGFALPLLAVDLMFVIMNGSNVIMLGHFGDASDVADYRVVQPAAHLNVLVMTSFTLLFTPMAARLFARDDREGIQELYWRTAVWIAVFSFPVFAATFALSHTLTVAMFGERYASSATILSLLSLGYYFSAALGFNGLTLRVYGLVRYSVVIAVLAAIANVALNLVLIPRYGALGAGVGTCATLVIHNLLKQIGLRKGTGISVLHRRHVRVYGVIVVAAASLLALREALDPGLVVSVVLVAATSLAVLALTRESLRVGDTFPELLRIPGVRALLS
ncbi:MAG TPA: flippase [Solirubrobacteraceae bacterium]|nr:flippase [Solirubrobacteraceae bacterium]